MSEVKLWNPLVKTSVDSSHYLPVTGKKRIQLLSLFPSVTTVGTGTAIYSAITNSNQFNLRALASLHAAFSVAVGGGGQIDFNLIPGNINLNTCDNSVSLFLKSVNLASNVGATILPLANGGTGLATIPKGSIFYGSALNVLSASSPLNVNGQLLVGNASSGIPSLANLLSSDSSLTITNGAGSIDLKVSFPNITGSISSGQITSLVATKITGSILNAQITSLDAAKLTGSVPAAAVANNSIPSIKLSDTGVLNSTYADVATAADTVTVNAIICTILAGTLSDGDSVELDGYGSFAANANNKTVSVTLDGTKTIMNNIVVAPNGVKFFFKAVVQRKSNTSASVSGQIYIGHATVPAFNIFSANVAISDFNGANIDVSINIQNSVAAASDIIVSGATGLLRRG